MGAYARVAARVIRQQRPDAGPFLGEFITAGFESLLGSSNRDPAAYLNAERLDPSDSKS